MTEENLDYICPCGQIISYYQYMQAIVDYPCNNPNCSKHLSDYHQAKHSLISE